jgi:hypothetical protein
MARNSRIMERTMKEILLLKLAYIQELRATIYDVEASGHVVSYKLVDEYCEQQTQYAKLIQENES